MSRRKTLLILIVLGLMVLLLSPWTSSPVSVPAPSGTPDQPAGPVNPAVLPSADVRADLIATAVASEDEYERLGRQAEEQKLLHPEIDVKWNRIDPRQTGLREALRAAAEESDVLLVPGESIRELAVGGELLPVDTAFVGEAQSEQWGALLSQVKWNSYLWGVPLEFDPYVLVWNRNVLDAATADAAGGASAGESAVSDEDKSGDNKSGDNKSGDSSGSEDKANGNGAKSREDGSRLAPPLSLEQWEKLPRQLADRGLIASWLALDGSDPLAWLAWLGAASGKREDSLLDRTGDGLDGAELERAMKLLYEQQAGLALEPARDGTFWPAFAAGRYAAVVARNSEAVRGIGKLPSSASAALEIDRSAWRLPFAWPAGSIFAVSSRTEHEDAARTWIAEMTSAANQRQNYLEGGKLPVYRSLYDGEGIDLPDLAVSESDSFPNLGPLTADPAVAAQLSGVPGALRDWLSGSAPFDTWLGRWRSLLAEAETDD